MLHSSVDKTLMLVPLYAGARYRFGERWSVVADAGFTYRYLGTSEAAVGMAFGVGYRAGKLHSAARSWCPTSASSTEAPGS